MGFLNNFKRFMPNYTILKYTHTSLNEAFQKLKPCVNNLEGRLANENVPDHIRKEYLPPNSCDLNPLDYANWDMKKMDYKNVKQYEDIEELSAAISNAWDRLTKKMHQ